MSPRKGADLGIAAGAAGLNYRGAFSPVATYAVNDVVTYSGSLYRNKTAIAQTAIAAPLTAHYEVAPTSITYNLVLPAGIVAGDLIMVASTCNTSPMTMPAGWTAYSQVGSGAYSVTGTVFTKVATSTDAGSTVVVNVQEQQGIVVRSYTTAGLDTSAGTSSSTTPSLTPTVFPSKIVSFFGSVVVAATAPAGVSNAYSQNRSSGDARATLGCDEVITGGSSTPRTAGAVTNSNAGVDTLAFALKPVQPSGAFDVTKWDLIGVLSNSDTAAQHYQGAWDNSKAYAANDVVTHAYGLWVALVAAASGVPAPSTNPTYPIANATVGGSYATTLASAGGGNGNNDVAWPFTTTAAGGVVDTVILGTAQFNANAATVRVGIATAIGSSATTDVVWLGATPSAVSLQASVGQQSFALPAAVTLAGSTTYFLVVQGVSGATPAANTRGVNGGSSPSGIVATANQMYGNSGASRAWGSPFAYAGVWSLVNGSLPYWQDLANTREATVVSKTAAYTMVDPDTVVLANGTFTVTLPVASAANVGKRYTVKNTGTGTITVAPQGTATIDGAANTTITLQYDGLDFANDGTNWFRV